MSRKKKCKRCDGWGTVDDPSACGDPDHCSPMVICPKCHGTGKRKKK